MKNCKLCEQYNEPNETTLKALEEVNRIDLPIIQKITEFIREGFAERCPHEGFNNGYRLALSELKQLLDKENSIKSGHTLQKHDIEQKYKDFRDYILEKEKEGKIVVNTVFGLGELSLDAIVQQHTEGLLYDLNRDRSTILTFIEDEKWVNDFACMKVIEKLKSLLIERKKRGKNARKI